MTGLAVTFPAFDPDFPQGAQATSFVASNVISIEPMPGHPGATRVHLKAGAVIGVREVASRVRRVLAAAGWPGLPDDEPPQPRIGGGGPYYGPAFYRLSPGVIDQIRRRIAGALCGDEAEMGAVALTARQAAVLLAAYGRSTGAQPARVDDLLGRP